MTVYLCAVDVGTGSARAGVLDAAGRLCARAEHPIVTQRPAPGHAEHDSEDIWSAVSTAVRGAVARAGIAAEDVAGISFDATCSLVVRDTGGRPVSVSTTGQARWDTIVWLDHRAMAEAEDCTATGHAALAHLGSVMSPEMQLPKLMWLKRHLPQSWARTGLVFDLADFLSWKASGSTARSQCTLTAKWGYLSHEAEGWPADLHAALGLDDLIERGGLPLKPVPAGTDLGPLTDAAARDLGLTARTRVGAGLVDAYAGALGLIGPYAGDADALERRMALIAGTSSCVMVLSRRPVAFPGAWGPFLGVALPDFWLSEGGQSASGALLDHVLRWHRAGGEPSPELHRRVIQRVGELRRLKGPAFAARLNVLPDFHGNRSPLADPQALGVISGLDMDASFDSLCALYWRTAVALALGIRHVLDALRDSGRTVDVLQVTGGHTRNPLLMELYADATGCRVAMLADGDATLLGTAMAAAAASGVHADLAGAAAAMAGPLTERLPEAGAMRRYDADYQVFLAMHEQRRALDRMIAGHQKTGPAGHARTDHTLVIFDCDGVLVDSEVIATEVLADHLADCGIRVDRDLLAARVLGRSASHVNAYLGEAFGVRIDAAAERRLQERLFARFRANLKPMPGVLKLIDGLAAPYCLASSSSVKRIQVALAATGLTERFMGRIFSAAMVARGKPAPDLFLHAAKVMGVDPRDCVVVEDSPAGVEAARRAGMRVIGFLGGSHARGLEFRTRLSALSPDATCVDLGDLPELIEAVMDADPLRQAGSGPRI